MNTKRVLPILLFVSLASLLASCSQQKAADPTAPMPTGPAATLEGKDLALAGKTLFDSQPCVGCHQFGGKGGKMGPKLDHAGDDHDYSWHYLHLMDPKSKTPGSKMPSFASRIPREQVELLAKWLASLK